MSASCRRYWSHILLLKTTTLLFASPYLTTTFSINQVGARLRDLMKCRQISGTRDIVPHSTIANQMIN